MRDAKEVRAVNDLLSQGVEAVWADGAVVVPAGARGAAEAVADRYGVAFTRARSGAGVPLTPVRVAAAVSADELFTLRELGFAVTPVSTAVLNAGFDWSGADVLVVSSGLSHAALDPPRPGRRSTRSSRPAAWSRAAAPARPSTPPRGCSPRPR
ncbi:hypothetical protein ACFSTC_41295 [Nonomuraea ferruginea]